MNLVKQIESIEAKLAQLKQIIEVYENAPPEAHTEAEKIAYAFGWFKAMEKMREKQCT